MKKIISFALCILLIALLATSTFATSEGPQITLQPQSPVCTEYSVVIYTVRVDTPNLTATWYMEWSGHTYTISAIGDSMQDWEAYAGELYGTRQLDDYTFCFIFEGIEKDLDGAYIWCVLEDDHYDVTSQKALISVSGEASPPFIQEIPAQLTVEQGAQAELRCVATSPDESQLSFLWYETDTGRLEDMRAVNRGTETADYLFLDTSMAGTRSYICCVQTSNGGTAYSSVVPVTITEKAAPTSPTDPSDPAPEDTTVPSLLPEEIPEGTTLPAPSSPTQPTDEGSSQTTGTDLPWWSLVIVGLVGAGVGVAVAIVLMKKSKNKKS